MSMMVLVDDERTFDPHLARVLGYWLAALFGAMDTNEPIWGQLEPYISRVTEYLNRGPTADIPDDAACIEALTLMAQIADIKIEGVGQTPINYNPPRPS